MDQKAGLRIFKHVLAALTAFSFAVVGFVAFVVVYLPDLPEENVWKDPEWICTLSITLTSVFIGLLSAVLFAFRAMRTYANPKEELKYPDMYVHDSRRDGPKAGLKHLVVAVVFLMIWILYFVLTAK